jgi:hypothetical protein
MWGDLTLRKTGHISPLSRASMARYHGAMTGSLGGHQRIDRRSLAMHQAIADKLRADPSLLAVARENLARWSKANGSSQPYWDAWQEILNRPLAEVLALMVEDSEKMTAMRQANPFAGILTPRERWAIYDQFPCPTP